MKITVVFSCFIVICIVSQAAGWWGGGSRSSRSSSSASRSSSSRSGWWGRPRKTVARRPATRTSTTRRSWWRGTRTTDVRRKTPKPKPATKPKTSRRWWRRPRKTVARRPATRTITTRRSWWRGTRTTDVRRKTPKPKPATKPKTSRRSWWRGTRTTDVRRKTPKLKPATKPKTPRRWWRRGRSRQHKPVKKPQQNTDIKAVIEKYEGGPRLTAYDAQPNNKNKHDTTIGIGFNMNRPDARKTFKKVLPGVNFDKVKKGEQSITETQARKLFNNDVDNIYVPRAKDKVGTETYESLPSNVKTAVVNAVFRGDLGPKAAKLMREGKWDKVKEEYLDHRQYKNADALGIPGIKTRMDWNAEQFESMIKPKN